MHKYIQVFSYNYPRDMVFDAVLYALKWELIIENRFHDRKSGYICGFRGRPPYIEFERLVIFALRDDEVNKTNVSITECNRKSDLPDMFSKRYNKAITNINKLIIKYLEQTK